MHNDVALLNVRKALDLLACFFGFLFALSDHSLHLRDDRTADVGVVESSRQASRANVDLIRKHFAVLFESLCRYPRIYKILDDDRHCLFRTCKHHRAVAIVAKRPELLFKMNDVTAPCRGLPAIGIDELLVLYVVVRAHESVQENGLVLKYLQLCLGNVRAEALQPLE